MEVVTCEKDLVTIPLNKQGDTLTLVRGDRLTLSGIGGRRTCTMVNEHTVSPFVLRKETVKKLWGTSKSQKS